MREFNDIIEACGDRLKLRADEYPPSDYEWSIKEVAGIDELIETFKHGNWCKRTGFVLGSLAFIEQVSGGNEWLALRRENGEWKPFKSISFYHMLQQRGEDHCRSFINRLLEPPQPERERQTAPGEEARTIAGIVEQIRAGTEPVNEPFVYVEPDTSLAYLTEKQAEIAIYLGVPIGARKTEADFVGPHKGECPFTMIESMSYRRFLSIHKDFESKVAVYPRLRDPQGMLELIKQAESMGLSDYSLMAAGEYGLKALRKLGESIETTTGGKQRLAVDSLRGAYITHSGEAAVGLKMRRQMDVTTGLYRLQFQAYMRRMGGDMFSSGLREIAKEADQIAGILSNLERNPIVVSGEQLEQFENEVTARQLVVSISAAAERDPQLDPSMGMM